MFAFLTRLLRVRSDRDIKPTLDLFFWLLPAYLVATIGAIATVIVGMNLPGSDLASSFLNDAFGLWIFTIIYVAVPLIVCALSDPVWIKLAIRTLAASLVSFLPRLALFFEAVGDQTARLTVRAIPLGVRFAIRPQPPIPAFGFSPGASPQIE